MTVFNIVYMSFATQPMTDESLEEILTKSRSNNTRLGLTGMLLYRDRFFLQALEGDEPTVRKLYNKIKDDPRHKNIRIMHEGQISERAFSDWSMGFNRIDDARMKKLGFTDFMAEKTTQNYFTEQPNRAMALLESFRTLGQ